MDANLLHLLKTRYTQLGGLRLVREYARMGLLWPAVKQVLRHPFSKQTYKQVYLDTVRKVEPYMPDKVPAKVEGTYYESILKELYEDILDNYGVVPS